MIYEQIASISFGGHPCMVDRVKEEEMSGEIFFDISGEICSRYSKKRLFFLAFFNCSIKESIFLLLIPFKSYPTLILKMKSLFEFLNTKC